MNGYLLDIFNTFAAEELHIDRALLPNAGLLLHEQLLGNELRLLYSETYEQEERNCVQFADRLRYIFPESTTAIIVNANRDAEILQVWKSIWQIYAWQMKNLNYQQRNL